MRRNARVNQHADDYPLSNLPIRNSIPNNTAQSQMDLLPADELTSSNNNTYRFENTIEAKVEIGDTLQAIALRFHCTVADIRRLNKIDKDNEIHARKVVKIPVTVHNVLLDNIPITQESGKNSPTFEHKSDNGSRDSSSGLSGMIRNPLEDAEAMLSEKLMVASVNSSSLEKPSTSRRVLTKESSMNSKFKSGTMHKYTGDDILTSNVDDISAPLITDILDDSTAVPQLHRIKGPSLAAMDWSGSDCDMSWICLFIVILALCFVIPLIYVFYIAEHSHHNTTGSISPPHH